MDLKDFLAAYAGWKVYLYQGEGTLHCPVCQDVVAGILMPPFYCKKDKLFFDACLDDEVWEARRLEHARLKPGDLESMFRKYEAIAEIFGGR